MAPYCFLLGFEQMLNTFDGAFQYRVGAVGQRSPERDWVRIRSAILRALDGHPGARESVVQALVELRALDEGEGR